MAEQRNIAFQGVPGPILIWPVRHMHLTSPLPCDSFSDMISAVQTGTADLAMVPVENSTAGRVADIHHLLPESGLFIVGEHYQPVHPQAVGNQRYHS